MLSQFSLTFEPVLKPSDSEAARAKGTIDAVVRCIHRLDSISWRGKVDRVVKGGSFGKATNLPCMFDVDLVCFINYPGLDSDAHSGTRRSMLREAQGLLARELGAAVLAGAGDRRLSIKYNNVEVDLLLVENR